MWQFFIDNRRFSYLIMVALVGFGLYAIQTIPKESSPEVQIPVGIVTTTLPGASATEVEAQITNQLERALDGSLDRVDSITSVSRSSVSSITVEYEATADVDESIRDLRDAVADAQNDLPDDATESTVSDVDFVDQPIVSFSVGGAISDRDQIDLADAIETRIQDVPGVSRVNVSGSREREVHVVVDQSALARVNLTVGDVTQAIRAANSDVPVGSIVSNETTYNVIFAAGIENPEDIGQIPIISSGAQPLLVRDVAEVVDGVSAASTLSRLSEDGAPAEPALTFDVYKQRSADIMTVSGATLDEVDKLAADQRFSDLTFVTLLDAGELISDDLIQLTQSGLQTAALVTLLLVVALGWREGIIAGLAIPLSFTIGFIGLLLSGNTINFISLFALILSIGILVDSSIVVVESINRRMKADPDADKDAAARDTVAAFQAPIMAGTLTTIAVFAGLFTVSGITGQFIASIPYTLVFVLAASLLVALGFIPLFAASFLRRRSNTRIEQAQVRYATRLEKWYSARLHRLLTNTRAKLLVGAGLIVGFVSAIALIPLGFVEVIFFGADDADTLTVTIETPAGTSQILTDRAVRSVEEVLYDFPDITSFRSTVGAGGSFGNEQSGANVGNVYLNLDADRASSSSAIADSIRAATANLPDTEITISQPNAGPPTGSPIGVTLTGDDLDELNQTARNIADTLAGIPGTTNIDDGTTLGNTEFVFTLDSLVAAGYGLTPQTVSQSLRSAVVGTEATTLRTFAEEIPVTVRLNLANDRGLVVDQFNYADISTLETISIATPTGSSVLIGNILDTSLREARDTIRHEDRDRVVSVTADTTDSGNVREINAALMEEVEANDVVPDGVTLTLAGETEEADQGFADLFRALIIGIVLMLGILVLQFDSFRYPVYVLSIVPFSLIGILYGLALVGSPLSFPSLMGFIALTGIVVNNSILLIDVMNSNRREQPSQTIREAVVSGAASRLRPIILTTITTVVGITPLLFSDPIWVPLATAIMFGLSFSVVITLILIPIIYDSFPGTLPKR